MGNNARSNGGGVTPMVTLLLNPGPSQQALRVTLEDRTDLRDRAVMLARQQYGLSAKLGWLDHKTNKVTNIVRHQPGKGRTKR